MKTKSLGLIDHDRLKLIPEKHWKAHEFCFYLHDKIGSMLVEYEKNGAHLKVEDAFLESIEGREKDFEEVNLLEFLKNHNLTPAYHQHIIGHVVFALTADMLNFLYEALTCFEKRKFTCGFALLRKPLKEHLLHLAWVLGDEHDFIARFEKDTSKSLNTVQPEKRFEIYEKAILKLPMTDVFDPEFVCKIIYSKNFDGGFEIVCQKATHLVTSFTPILKTQDYSFNMIFENAFDDQNYHFLYDRFPYLMLLILFISLEAFNRISALNRKTYDHLLLTSTGVYESLFVDGRKQKISSTLTKSFSEFLKCIHCGEELKISKKNAAHWFISERILCNKCGLVSEFPLYWILAYCDIKIIPDAPKK